MNKNIKLLFNKYKILIIISLVVFLLIGIFLLIGNSFGESNRGYLRNQSVDGLSFENAELIYENGVTTFIVDVYNESGDVYSLKNISINLKDENNNVTTLIGYIGETLEKDESKLITASIDKDLSSSNNLEYVINK